MQRESRLVPSPNWILLLLATAACSAPAASTATGAATNASLNFVVPRAEKTLEHPATVCLAVAKPGRVALQNGPDRDGAIDGRAQVPAGTRAEAIVSRYAALLTRNGWVAGTDFVASGNALHFYGITELAAGAGDAQLGVHGSTDSDDVPFRSVSPLAQ